ncbi:hypothetical protein JCM3770_003257 [Rhodotorula araucariae]
MTRSVAIVGGGIVGSATAFLLARLARTRGVALDITLVEGTAIAAGASGKAGGLLALDWHGPNTASLAALSYQLHAALAQEFNGADRWGYRQLDTLSVSADFSTSTATTDAKRARQKRLKGADLFPWLNHDLVTASDVLGGRDTTAQVHPEQLTTFLASAAQDLGVRLVYGTATGIALPVAPDAPYTLSLAPLADDAAAPTAPAAPDASTPVAVRASGPCPHELAADQVVVAAGPWTGALLASFGLAGTGAQAGRAAEIEGSRAHSVVLRTAEGRDLPAQALFTSIKETGGHAEPEIYNRPDGTAYACGPTDSSALPASASAVSVDAGAIAKLVSQVARLSPSHLSESAGATVVRTQACYLPVGSGDPVIGRVHGDAADAAKGVYVASGHSCWGICNGPGTGQVVAELLLDGVASSADIGRLGP